MLLPNKPSTFATPTLGSRVVILCDESGDKQSPHSPDAPPAAGWELAWRILIAAHILGFTWDTPCCLQCCHSVHWHVNCNPTPWPGSSRPCAKFAGNSRYSPQCLGLHSTCLTATTTRFTSVACHGSSQASLMSESDHVPAGTATTKFLSLCQ